MANLNFINPSAGGVPLPEDHRELTAAIHAGEISYRLFPYLDWRYGERGRDFTKSDSAWLTWLTRQSEQRMKNQIDWLCSVLGNRGMPTNILEVHLRVLYRTLSREIPEMEPKYAKLAMLADRIEKNVAQHIGSNKANALEEGFVFGCPVKNDWLVRGIARLIIRAVADEKNGIEKSVSSLLDWLEDVNQISPHLANGWEFVDGMSQESLEDSWKQGVQTLVSCARAG